MKHLYHFYVVKNNVEKIELTAEMYEFAEADRQIKKIMEKIKVRTPQETKKQIVDFIEKNIM